MAMKATRSVGRPEDERKDGYASRFRLSERQRRRLTQSRMDQLDRCSSDAERRVILGIVEPELDDQRSGRKYIDSLSEMPL